MFMRFATVAGILLAFQVSSAVAGPCDSEVQAALKKAAAAKPQATASLAVATTPAKVNVLAKQAEHEAATKPAKLEALVKQAKADVATEPAKAEAEPAKVKVSHRGGGNRKGLTPAMLALLDRIESKFGPVNVISGYRPGARIATTGRISRHASGNAADIDAGSRKAAIVKWLIANHHNGGTMTYSDMSHIHVDIGPHFVALGAYSGTTGRRHYARSRYRGSSRYSDSGYARHYSDRRSSHSRSRRGYSNSYQPRRFASGYATIYQ